MAEAGRAKRSGLFGRDTRVSADGLRQERDDRCFGIHHVYSRCSPGEKKDGGVAARQP